MKLHDISVGDILIYKEEGANSLNVIIDINGVLYPKPLVIDYNGYIDWTNPLDKTGMIPLHEFYDENSWSIAEGFDLSMDGVSYMNEVLPL